MKGRADDGRPADRPADCPANDEGRALIEVIFLAVLILIPTVYILISFLRIQSATFAVSQGAREAGRRAGACGGHDQYLLAQSLMSELVEWITRTFRPVWGASRTASDASM